MADIIWNGNQDWEEVWNGKQRWDEEMAQVDIPKAAKLLPLPDDIVKASLPYMIFPGLLCFAAVYLKVTWSQEPIVNLWYLPLAFMIGFVVAMPLHEYCHAMYYPKDATVYIGICLRQLRAYVVSAAALTRQRFILMSLAPMFLGIISLLLFLMIPASHKGLLTLTLVSSFMGLISPAPDYLIILAILRHLPRQARLQATSEGLIWYQSH